MAGVVVLAMILTGCGAVHLHDHDVSAADRKACTALVDVARLGTDDHVVGTGDVLGEDDALDVGDPLRDLRGLADIGLDQDVGLDDHVDSLGCGKVWIASQPTGRPAGAEHGGRGHAPGRIW